MLKESVLKVTFKYKFKDYQSAPRSEIVVAKQILEKDQIPGLARHERQHELERHSCSLAAGSSATSRQSQLHVEHDNRLCSTEDVGQMSRGRRYSYKVCAIEGQPAVTSFSLAAAVHTAMEVLTRRGLSPHSSGWGHPSDSGYE